MKLHHFEDLNVGDRFCSAAYEVSEAAIVSFAREFDVQPFHLEHDAANASPFRGLAASGWHTAAIAMRLFTTGPLQFAGGIIGLGVDEMRWPVAVRPGDRLQFVTEVLELRPSKSKPGHGIVRIRNVMTNQNGEIVIRYEANAMIARFAASAAGS